MSDNICKKIDDLLLEALNSEIEAEKFYKNASLKAQSNAGKSLFSKLAEFEQNHYSRVKKIIESRDNGLKIEKPDYCHDDLKVESEVEGEFEPNKSEIATVISLAIESEKKAQVRYRTIAEMFDDEVGKNIFYDFEREEKNHQKILEDEFYHLSNRGTIIWGE